MPGLVQGAVRGGAVLVAFGLVLFGSPLARADSLSTNLNIVLFCVDDLGWTDTNSGRVNLGNGSDFYETPALLRMNWEGLVFTRCYMQPRGAASRAISALGSECRLLRSVAGSG